MSSCRSGSCSTAERRPRTWSTQATGRAAAERGASAPLQGARRWSIELLANLLDEREIALYGGEVAAATQDQLLLERGLEPVVGLLHDAVLVGFARLDACRAHSVVVEHCLEPAVELAPALG